MTKQTKPSTVDVYVGDRRYQVDLASEEVRTQVHVARTGKWHSVRVTSETIKTRALLRASDASHLETVAAGDRRRAE